MEVEEVNRASEGVRRKIQQSKGLRSTARAAWLEKRRLVLPAQPLRGKRFSGL